MEVFNWRASLKLTELGQDYFMEGPSYQHLSMFDKGSFHFPREESTNILAASALGSEQLLGRVSHSLCMLSVFHFLLYLESLALENKLPNSCPDKEWARSWLQKTGEGP